MTTEVCMCVCVCVRALRRVFHPSDMKGLVDPELDNGCIEEDVAPRGLAWMEGYAGVLGVDVGGGGGLCVCGGCYA